MFSDVEGILARLREAIAERDAARRHAGECSTALERLSAEAAVLRESLLKLADAQEAFMAVAVSVPDTATIDDDEFDALECTRNTAIDEARDALKATTAGTAYAEEMGRLRARFDGVKISRFSIGPRGRFGERVYGYHDSHGEPGWHLGILDDPDGMGARIERLGDVSLDEAIARARQVYAALAALSAGETGKEPT